MSNTDPTNGMDSFELTQTLGRTPSIHSETRSLDVKDKHGSTASIPETAPSRSQSIWTVRTILLVFGTTLGMIVNIAALSSISIAIPTIGHDLQEGEDTLQWLISAFALSNGCFLILFGRLADLYGRKRAFLLGAGWMTIFSIGCGFANNWVTLTVLRALQGLGPAAIIPASIGILAHTFPPSRARSIAFATFSAGAPLGGAIGFQLGGVMTQLTAATWRSNFYLMAGLCALIFIIGIFTIDNDVLDPNGDRRVDWIGATLVTVGLALLLFVLGESPVAEKGWSTPYLIALLVISLLTVATFIAWEHYIETHTSYPPLMTLNIWKRGNGRFSVMQVVAFLQWAGFNAFMFWGTLYFQLYVQLSPILTMIRFLPMTIAGVICNVIIMVIVGRVSGHWIITFGCICTGIAGLLFAVIDPSYPYWTFAFPATVLSVVGADFVFATGSLYVAKLAEGEEQSLAAALFQTLTQIGTAFGLTISTIAYDAVSTKQNPEHLEPPPREAQLAGYRAGQWVAFAFPVAAGVLALIFLRGVGVVGHDGKPEEKGDLEKKASDRQEGSS